MAIVAQETTHNPSLVLIVDDDPSFREIFSTLLTSSGYRVEVARDGKEGVEKTKALKPDLILMDVQMPGMSGVDAFLRIKEDPVNEKTKVIFITILGDPRFDVQEVNRRLAKEMGAVGYIRKSDAIESAANEIKRMLSLVK